MKSLLAAIAVSVLFASATTLRADEPQLAHIVFFKLKDRTDAGREKLVAACDKYLNDHDGTIYYSAGALADDLKGDLNDREFDVALHLVFRDKAAHDAYLVNPRHLKFIEENKATWGGVRVFDSYVKGK